MKTKDFSQDDEAVSPVIGVILMVAITVILAAVIGTFVLNLGSSINENVNAGAAVSCDAGAPGEVTLTYNSEGNSDKLNVTTFSIDGNQVTNDPGHLSRHRELSNVGESLTFTEDDGGHVTSTSNNHEVKWVVTAVSGEQSTVVADDDCQI